MKARYTVLDGEVLAEKRGGARRELVPDPLGSTVALLDSSQAITDTLAYWPYGEERSRTGATATPIRFVGTLGYYRDSTARSYVRARYLDRTRARWLTQDPIQDWKSSSNLLAYCRDAPITITDPRGLLVPQPPAPQRPPCSDLLTIYVKPPDRGSIAKCLAQYARDHDWKKLLACLAGPLKDQAKQAAIAYACCMLTGQGGKQPCDSPAQADKGCCSYTLCVCLLTNSSNAFEKFHGRIYPGLDKIVYEDCLCALDQQFSGNCTVFFPG